jgi:hypothetical protein
MPGPVTCPCVAVCDPQFCIADMPTTHVGNYLPAAMFSKSQSVSILMSSKMSTLMCDLMHVSVPSDDCSAKS